jgi:hypothetical protein
MMLPNVTADVAKSLAELGFEALPQVVHGAIKNRTATLAALQTAGLTATEALQCLQVGLLMQMQFS